MGGSQQWNGGAVASQEAIKELGTNGGGYFNANSAHPFENPNGFTNLFQIFLILLIPFALTRTFGTMAGSVKQGYAILATMVTIWLGFTALMMWTEFHHGGPAFDVAGGAMEGKETRFGIGGSSIFAVATTLTSTGAVNSFHSSFTGFGGGITLLGMQLGEIAPGGTGSGLYGMLIMAIIAVFIAGLMVGRTLRDPLRVHLGRQQQRLGLRRSERGHAVVQHHDRSGDAARPVPAADHDLRQPGGGGGRGPGQGAGRHPAQGQDRHGRAAADRQGRGVGASASWASPR
jgi:Potassium-transporting ATPase A subunit